MGISINKVSGGSTPVVAPYKVFTGLVTQSGGDDIQFINLFSEPNTLVIGVTYQITGGDTGFDVTNVGAPNNDVGTWFIATGTTPNWGDGGAELQYNNGAPTVTILENTLGNVWFSYFEKGWYANSNNLFLNGKVFVTSYSYYNQDKDNFINCGVDIDQGTTESYLTYFNVDNNVDGRQAYKTPIEIRVYN